MGRGTLLSSDHPKVFYVDNTQVGTDLYVGFSSKHFQEASTHRLKALANQLPELKSCMDKNSIIRDISPVLGKSKFVAFYSLKRNSKKYFEQNVMITKVYPLYSRDTDLMVAKFMVCYAGTLSRVLTTSDGANSARRQGTAYKPAWMDKTDFKMWGSLHLGLNTVYTDIEFSDSGANWRCNHIKPLNEQEILIIEAQPLFLWESQLKKLFNYGIRPSHKRRHKR